MQLVLKSDVSIAFVLWFFQYREGRLILSKNISDLYFINFSVSIAWNPWGQKIPLDPLPSQNPANWRHLIIIRQIRDNADTLNLKQEKQGKWNWQNEIVREDSCR